jgi:hypothetical protein
MWKLRRHAKECSTSHDEHVMCSLGQLCKVMPCMDKQQKLLYVFKNFLRIQGVVMDMVVFIALLSACSQWRPFS